MQTVTDWIGHQSHAQDVVTSRMVAEYRATLGPMNCHSGDLPGLEWCLSPDIYPADLLGRDSHPRLGLVLPDLGLPRRMWAGGDIKVHAYVSEGETISRSSTIRDIRFKQGRSGRLGFLTIEHLHTCGNAPRVTETQTIVYRDDPAADAPLPPAPPQADPWPAVETRMITPCATLLFRYSALTFNGHRIHYDLPYATNTEGYDGLVVHGPLQAVWMQHMARDILGHRVDHFTYRGQSPLICNRAAAVEARESASGLELRVRDLTQNVVTMSASAR